MSLAFGITGGGEYFVRNCLAGNDENRPVPGVHLAQRVRARGPVQIADPLSIRSGDPKCVEQNMVPFGRVLGQKITGVGFQEIEAHHETGATVWWR